MPTYVGRFVTTPGAGAVLYWGVPRHGHRKRGRGSKRTQGDTRTTAPASTPTSTTTWPVMKTMVTAIGLAVVFVTGIITATAVILVQRSMARRRRAEQARVREEQTQSLRHAVDSGKETLNEAQRRDLDRIVTATLVPGNTMGRTAYEIARDGDGSGNGARAGGGSGAAAGATVNAARAPPDPAHVIHIERTSSAACTICLDALRPSGPACNTTCSRTEPIADDDGDIIFNDPPPPSQQQQQQQQQPGAAAAASEEAPPAEDLEALCRLPCAHTFHAECLQGWIVQEFTRGVDCSCPLCRRGVRVALATAMGGFSSSTRLPSATTAAAVTSATATGGRGDSVPNPRGP